MFGFLDIDQDIFLVSNHILFYLSISFTFQKTPTYSCFQDI